MTRTGTAAGPARSGLLRAAAAVLWLVVAGILLGGLAGGALIGLGLGLTVLAGLVLAAPMAAIAAQRILPVGPVRAGESVSVTLRVCSRRWWPWLQLRVAEEAPVAVGAGTDEAHPMLLTRRPRTATYRMSDLPRGIHRFAEVRLTVADPFGLVQRRHLLNVPGELVVWPAPAAEEEVQALLPLAFRSHLAAAVGDETRSVRNYLPGDPPHLIHWPASARTGQVMSRQTDAARRGKLVIEVVALPGKLERACAQAAGLVEWGLRRQLAVGLRAGAEYVAPARGEEQLHRLMRCLAACGPEAGFRPEADVGPAAVVGPEAGAARPYRVSGQDNVADTQVICVTGGDLR